MSQLKTKKKYEEFIDSLLQEENFHSPIILYGYENGFLEKYAKELAHRVLRLSKNASTEKKIQSEMHPDLHIFQPEGKSNLYSTATLEPFIKESSLPPFESRYKVYLFTQADRMLPVHANALLKTLEEKKNFTVIILITTEFRSLLPTVVSRCQKISLSVEEKSPIVTNPLILTAIQLSFTSQYFDLITTIDALEKEEVSLSDVTHALLSWYRDLAIIKNNLPAHYLTYPEETDALLACAKTNFQSLESISKQIEIAFEALDRNVKLKHVLEYLLLR